MKKYFYIGADVKESSVNPASSSTKTVAIWYPQSFPTKRDAVSKCAELMMNGANCQRFFIAEWQKQLKLDDKHMCVGFIEEGK